MISVQTHWSNKKKTIITIGVDVRFLSFILVVYHKGKTLGAFGYPNLNFNVLMNQVCASGYYQLRKLKAIFEGSRRADVGEAL